MTNLISLFITLQIILLFIMALHDWMPIPPLNDIPTLKKHEPLWGRVITTMINTSFVAIPLMLTIIFAKGVPPRMALYGIRAFYVILSLGTIAAWWIPYIFGSTARHKAGFIEYRNTHHFLPAYKDHVVPNTLHVILHLFVWGCCFLSWYIW